MITAIIQARMTSTRLPGKVLKNLNGKPMLEGQLQRIKQAKTLDQIVVATSNDSTDEVIDDLMQALGVLCYRGSLTDVLDRYYQAARNHQATHVVRITADCPLIEPTLIDDVVQLHLNQENDYTSNVLKRTYPKGLDVEVMTMPCLTKTWQCASGEYEREHVTSYIYDNPDKFKIGCLKNDIDYSQLRWTVDTAEDYEHVTTLYEKYYKNNMDIGWLEVAQSMGIY